MLNQETNRINNENVMLPEEMKHGGAEILPVIFTRSSPLDLPVENFSKALMRREDNRRALLNWVKLHLRPNIDFGQIHVFGKEKCLFAKEGRANECTDPKHWSKASLWKSGAEKICGMLGLVPRFPNLNEFESATMRGEDIKVIIIKCQLQTESGFIAGEGIGARCIIQDSGDINKSLKMAAKSAHIDATLRVAGLSELFTQGLEDMSNAVRGDIPPDADRQASPATPQQTPNQPQSERESNRNGNGQGSDNVRITPKQYKFIIDLIEKTGISEQELNAHCVDAYGTETTYISRSDASSLISWLQSR